MYLSRCSSVITGKGDQHFKSLVGEREAIPKEKYGASPALGARESVREEEGKGMPWLQFACT